MGMTHYMELMMSSWYLLVLFMALPMFLAECYVVSEILLLLKGADQCPRLKVFNKASAYASAVVMAVRTTSSRLNFRTKKCNGFMQKPCRRNIRLRIPCVP